MEIVSCNDESMVPCSESTPNPKRSRSQRALSDGGSPCPNPDFDQLTTHRIQRLENAIINSDSRNNEMESKANILVENWPSRCRICKNKIHKMRN